jgi:hypothetical protein
MKNDFIESSEHMVFGCALDQRAPPSLRPFFP